MLFERLPVIRALHVLVLLSLTVVFPSYADRAVRQYAAKVETSSWTLDPQSNRLECRLIHHIDRLVKRNLVQPRQINSICILG